MAKKQKPTKILVTCDKCGAQRTTSKNDKIQCRECFAVIKLDDYTDRRFKKLN